MRDRQLIWRERFSNWPKSSSRKRGMKSEEQHLRTYISHHHPRMYCLIHSSYIHLARILSTRRAVGREEHRPQPLFSEQCLYLLCIMRAHVVHEEDAAVWILTC